MLRAMRWPAALALCSCFAPYVIDAPTGRRGTVSYGSRYQAYDVQAATRQFALMAVEDLCHGDAGENSVATHDGGGFVITAARTEGNETRLDFRCARPEALISMGAKDCPPERISVERGPSDGFAVVICDQRYACWVDEHLQLTCRSAR